MLRIFLNFFLTISLCDCITNEFQSSIPLYLFLYVNGVLTLIRACMIHEFVSNYHLGFMITIGRERKDPYQNLYKFIQITKCQLRQHQWNKINKALRIIVSKYDFWYVTHIFQMTSTYFVSEKRRTKRRRTKSRKNHRQLQELLVD